MVALFNGEIQYVNTKKQPLINSGIIIQSMRMQTYLHQKIDESLTIKEWIFEEKQKMRMNQQKFRGVGDIILNKLRRKLQEIVNKNERIELQQSDMYSDSKSNSYLVENNGYMVQQPRHAVQYEANLYSNIGYLGIRGVPYAASGINVLFLIISELYIFECKCLLIYTETRYCPWAQSNGGIHRNHMDIVSNNRNINMNRNRNSLVLIIMYICISVYKVTYKRKYT